MELTCNMVEAIKKSKQGTSKEEKVKEKSEKSGEMLYPNFPSKTFDLVYADPQWQYFTKYPSFTPKYPTLTLEQLSKVPLKVSEDALCLLRISSPIYN